MLPVDEQSKAIQETAKATGKGIDASRELGGFFNTIMGKGFKELGGTFQDWASSFRWRNMIKIQDKHDSICKQREIEGKTTLIPPRFAIPLIEAASLEDDDSLQDMWAVLIANATDPNMRINITKVHIEVLSKLEPIDSVILSQLDGRKIKLCYRVDGKKIKFDELINELCEENKASKDEVNFSFNNLIRLGCVENPKTNTIDDIGKHKSFLTIDGNFQLTVLGSSILEACRK